MPEAVEQDLACEVDPAHAPIRRPRETQENLVIGDGELVVRRELRIQLAHRVRVRTNE